MIAKSADVAEYYPLAGDDWLTFKSKMTGLVPTSERFDGPHCLLEAVLRESAGPQAQQPRSPSWLSWP